MRLWNVWRPLFFVRESVTHIKCMVTFFYYYYYCEILCFTWTTLCSQIYFSFVIKGLSFI